MNDDLRRVVDFMLMSRAVLRRIKLNIFFSIIYNAVGLGPGGLGMLTPVMAVIFQEAGCVSVVLSSTLLLWAKPKRSLRLVNGTIQPDGRARPRLAEVSGVTEDKALRGH